MPEQVKVALGLRSTDNVTITGGSGSDPTRTVTLSVPVPANVREGDAITDASANTYLNGCHEATVVMFRP